MQLKAAKLATWQFAHSKGLPRGLDAENLQYQQNWDLRWADAPIDVPEKFSAEIMHRLFRRVA